MNDWQKRLVCNVNLFCTSADEEALTEMFKKIGGDARNVIVTNFDGMIIRPPGIIGGKGLMVGELFYILGLMLLQRLVPWDSDRKTLKDKGLI